MESLQSQYEIVFETRACERSGAGAHVKCISSCECFMSLSKVYFVKFYMCISFCVHILNVLLHNTFSVIDFFFNEGLPSGLKKTISNNTILQAERHPET